MGAYEDITTASERIEHILGLHGVDNYQIEINNDAILSHIESYLSDGQSVLWSDSRKCVQIRATEHNRGYGAYARFTVLAVIEVPRSQQSTKIVKRRPGLAGKQLSISAGDEADVPTTPTQKKRNSRLTET